MLPVHLDIYSQIVATQMGRSWEVLGRWETLPAHRWHNWVFAICDHKDSSVHIIQKLLQWSQFWEIWDTCLITGVRHTREKSVLWKMNSSHPVYNWQTLISDKPDRRCSKMSSSPVPNFWCWGWNSGPSAWQSNALPPSYSLDNFVVILDLAYHKFFSGINSRYLVGWVDSIVVKVPAVQAGRPSLNPRAHIKSQL